MAQFDAIQSEILAKGEHEDKMDECYNCRMAAAVQANGEYESAHKTMVSNVLDAAPFAALVIRPLSQAIFDAFVLGLITGRGATITAIEGGKLEVWQTTPIQKAQAPTGK